MKNGKGKAVPFHGILAVGSTKDEAVNRYRLLALGKGVTAFVDQSQSVSFVTSASNSLSEMFNPKTGDLDLEANAALAGSLEFTATAGDVEATHYVCESGCGSHLVYDSEELVQFCPVCTSAVAGDDDAAEDSGESEEDEDMDLEDQDEDESEESESSDDAEDDAGESEEDEDLDAEDEEADDAEDEEEGDDADAEDEDEDEEADDAEDEAGDDAEDDSNAPLVIAADTYQKALKIFRKHRTSDSAQASNVEVNYVVCSSADCAAHILSEDVSLSSCPACKAPVMEPKAVVAGEDDEDAEGSDLSMMGNGSDGDESEEDEDEDDGADLDLDEDEDDEEDEESESSDEAADALEAAVPPVATPAPAPAVETMDVDALSQIDDAAEDAHKDMDLSFSSSIDGAPMWTAYFKGRPVATARVADAGANADIFDAATFGNAVIASARHVGVKNILRDMGFRGIVHPVAIAAVVKAEAAKEVATATATLDRERVEYAERFMAAMATAAIGVNRGFFADVKNPLKEQLWDAMSSAGIRNPEVLINNVFRASSDAYHSTLFAKASEIIAKPLEVQESLARAVMGTNYMSVEASGGSAGSALEERLSEFGTATAAANKPEEKESITLLGSANKIVSVVASLGRRR